MFAIDGPIDSISASTGVSDMIHAPAARPPGTPPVPARNEVEPAALMPDQLSSASDATTAVVTTTPTARAARALSRPIQQMSSDSRHDHRRTHTTAASIPAAHTITAMPIAGGTTAG